MVRPEWENFLHLAYSLPKGITAIVRPRYFSKPHASFHISNTLLGGAEFWRFFLFGVPICARLLLKVCRLRRKNTAMYPRASQHPVPTLCSKELLSNHVTSLSLGMFGGHHQKLWPIFSRDIALCRIQQMKA